MTTRTTDELAGLSTAIADTIAASEATSARVIATLDDAADRLGPAFTQLEDRLAASGRLAGDLHERLATATDSLAAARRHAADRRALLEDFRVAMFGRTGVGKSSLIEALTRGDAKSVSPGQGDHTEDVREERWGPLLVVDMPGTLGAGRRLSREELEARTEAEVKRADLVILAFDTQNQQVAEFERAAQMVLRYEKPVIAVLNVRNDRWRNPDPSFEMRKRRKRDVDVGQHVRHLDHELSRIGVHGCPIVAINTQHATFARCDPYLAPGFTDTRDRKVATYGRQLLEEASNIAALEAAVVRLITGSCGALREAGLIGDLRAGLGDVAAALEGVAPSSVIEAGIDRLFRDVGYPREPRADVTPLTAPPISAIDLQATTEGGPPLTAFEVEALELAAQQSCRASDGITRAAVTTPAGDELLELERQRGAPFGAPTIGKFHDRLDQRMTIALRPERLKALRRAEDAVLAATKQTTIDAERDILRVEALQPLAAGVIDEAVADAARMLDRNAARVAASFGVEAASLDVKVGGRVARTGSFAARFGSLGTGTALVIAATNWWNPGGWTIGVLTVGSVVASFLGSRFSKKAEQKRLEARARSIADARRLVNDTFDALERNVGQTFWAALTAMVASRAVTPLRDATDAYLVQNVIAAINDTSIPAVDDAARPTDLPPRNVLLGEKWAPSAAGIAVDPPQDRAGADASDFVDLAWTPLADLLDRAALDATFASLESILGHPQFAGIRDRVAVALSSRPKVALCGDYSSAKSSLRAVITRSTPASRRRVKRGADPTTSDTETGRLGQLRIVDTPGLGSPRPDDAIKAERAIEDASLVLYLLTPRLIADVPSVLIDQLVGAGPRGATLRSRTRFVLTRIDELGASPSDAPHEFVTSVNNKRHELARILSERGIPIEPRDVICVAPDPYGSDFDERTLEESAPWNGIARLTAELQHFGEASPDLRPAAIAIAAAELERIHQTARHDLSLAAEAVEQRHSLMRSAERAHRDTVDLSETLRLRLVDAVVPIVTEIVDHAVNTTGNEREAALDKAKRWLSDPRITSELDRWQAAAAHAIADHAEAVSSELARQFDAVYATFGVAEAPDLVDHGGTAVPSALKTTAARLSDASKHLGTMDASKVLKIRDALTKLPIPPDMLKFRPWGATKLAKQLRYAGRVAAVAGVAIETVTIVLDERGKRKHEQARHGTRDQVIKDLDDWFEEIMTGDDEAPGVATILGGLASQLDEISEDVRVEITDLETGVEETRSTIRLIDDFMSGAAADGK